MSIQYQTTPFNQKVTALNDNKFRLYAPTPIEGNQNGRVPTLYVDTKGNNPRMMVRLNNGKQGDEGRIELNLDLPTMTAILIMMEDAIRAKQAMTQAVQVKRGGWDRQANKPRDPWVFATIHVGKDADGLEFIGVQTKQQKIAFYFTEAEFHPFIDTATNQPATRQQVSNVLARSWVKMMSILVPMVVAHVWNYDASPEGQRARRDREKNGGNGNNNQGGYSNNNGYNANRNNGGYNNNQQQQPQYNPQPAAALAPAEQSFSNDGFEDVPF